MPSQACFNVIRTKSPPIYCGEEGTSAICGQIQGDINEYCTHNGLGSDVPVPQFTAGGKCWCCCSCLAWGTPIEVAQGTFKLIEAIVENDTVLATGGKLDGWEDRTVTGVGGIAPGVPLDFCYTSRFKLADGTERTIISTADHLFLIPGGKLQPIQDLRPGDVVMQADGAQATVALIAIGQFSGGVRNFAMGEYDPKAYPDDPYKGHLMNTFGLVTADLAVQTAYYSKPFDVKFVADAKDIPQIGSTRFFEKYDTTAYDTFVRTPELWPANFKATIPRLINIPPSALAYFTKLQAADLLEAEGDQNMGNSDALARFKYLRRVFGGFYPSFYYVADWSQDTPNAWYFNEADQTYIVLSGGLLRLSTLSIPGISIVMSHLVAQAGGYGCTGDADYYGAAIYLREVWFDELFFDMMEKGLPEIKKTFKLVKPEHAGENPNNICAQPSLDCRVEALTNAGYFGGVPDCAKPPADFEVTGAVAKTQQDVEVSFSADLFQGTATNPSHYTIGGAEVLQVRLDANKKTVNLTVNGLRSSTSYTVVVTGVLSERGQRLSPQHSSAKFKTP